MDRLAITALCSIVLVVAMPDMASAHGDARVVDEVVSLDPGAAATYEIELHYHRLVGQVSSNGPVRVSVRHAFSGEEVVAFAPGTERTFNQLIRCCNEVWASHHLTIENVHDTAVTVTARASVVHDDLAVMVDGAESGTRAAIVLLGIGWWAMARRAFRRTEVRMPLRVPVIGLAVLTTFILGAGSYASVRYGVGGAPAVVAGTGDLPVMPMNPIVSRASLLMGFSMLGWALVGVWWIQARTLADRRRWTVLGFGILGAASVVAVAITVAYGGPLVQAGWILAAAPPIVAVLVGSRNESSTTRDAGF